PAPARCGRRAGARPPDRLAGRRGARRAAGLGDPAPRPAPTPPPASPPVPRPAPAGARPAGGTDGDIAVIGASGRYPGAPDLDTFWANLDAGRDSVTEIPGERWDWRAHFDPRRGRDQRTYGRWGGFLEGIDLFDPAFFGILPKDAADIDPQERLFLETCWELLDRAGRLGETTHERMTGVFAGVMYGSYGRLAATGWDRGRLSGAHSAYWSVANRVSYHFDFEGPSFAVDSACSSSLTAVHLACESLRRGECRMAVAGGVNLVLHPSHHVALSAMNMLSADGACKVFDARADGFTPGEGVGAVLLRPLADAVRDGDEILAVIKGGMVNAGGRTGGYTVPNPGAQARLIARAVRRSGVDPRSIGYLEAHGTGTALGDPIEMAALHQAFEELGAAPDRCAVSSVKANIGHLEGAAGIAGLTRVLLQMRHGRIAGCAHLDEVNPRIELPERSPFRLPRGSEPWPRPEGQDGRPAPRRAGISSFGAGGANAHLIVEEYLPGATADRDEPAATPGATELFLLSARTGEQLAEYARRVAATIGEPDGGTGPSLRRLAHTSQVGRRDLPVRVAVPARSADELRARLAAFASGGRDERVITGTAGADPLASALLSGEDGAAFLDGLLARRDLEKLARIWVTGVTVAWDRLWPAPAPRRVALPPYPFDRRRHWLTLPEPPTTTAVPEPPAATEEPGTEQPGTGEAPVVAGEPRYLRPVHVPAPLPSPGAAGDGGPREVLLLAAPATTATAEALAALLAARGARRVTVFPGGPAPVPAGTDRWTMDLSSPEAYAALLARLADAGRRPDAVVHLPDGTADPAGPPSAVLLPLWSAAEALLDRGAPRPLRLVHVVPPAAPARHTAMAAVLRTLALEHTGCSGVCLTQEPDTAPGRAADRIAAELAAPGGQFEIEYRDGERLERRVEPFAPTGDDAPSALPLRPGGTYLLLGGTGALALHTAEFLARHGRPLTLVLAARSAPGDDARRRMATVAGDGVTVHWATADVTDRAGVERLVAETAERFGGPHGVIHAAGITRDGLAAGKDRAALASVLAPKVTGVLNVDAALGDRPLDFLVLYSSVAAETGNIGQADYAYANAFLNRFAEEREARRRAGERHGRTVAIGWPLWADGGMTVDDGVRDLFARRWDMAPMSTGTGLRVLCRALGGTEPVLLAVESATAPARTLPAEQVTSAHLTAERVTTGHVTAAGPEELAAEVSATLRRVAAGFLMVDEHEVDPRAELLDSGFDSISLTQLTGEVNDIYGLDLLPTVLFECPTLDDFARHLCAHHGPAITAAATGGPPVAAPAPAAPAPDPAPPPPPRVAPRPAAVTAPAETGRQQPVAVIGMAGILPGSPTLTAFWDHLAAGRDLVGPVPGDRAALLADPRTRQARGGFLPDIAGFDARFFSISPAEAALMDPQQRLFLEVVWRAFQDAGYASADLAGSATGLFAGVSTSDYDDLLRDDPAAVRAHMASGLSHAVLANRVSHHFGLRGPSEAVDTACSSALVALHRAVRALAA
ncbi:SDR family oxidoreductase, partial [Streptomyces specialis]|uniref:SDR family oxidoreductase n=1 Tax=Streptomyces specialis TaxID=498367 RepID=UPI00131ADD57